jgi:hypothetical protein
VAGAAALVLTLSRGRAEKPSLAAPVPSSSAPTMSADGPLPSGAEPAVATPTLVLGANGCTIEDRGNGAFTSVKGPAGAKVWFSPTATRPDGGYDLLLHFHGGDAVRKVLAPDTHDLVLATIDRGDSSGDYRGTVPDRRSWDELLAGIDRGVGEATGGPAHARRIVVSSWSAGFGAVDEVLGVAGDELSGVVLLDSLYASYEGQGMAKHPAPVPRFVAAAKRSLERGHFLFALTHSDVKPPDYASTKEVADALLAELFVRSSPVDQRGPAGVGLSRVAEERGFVLRGYSGGDEAAHCAHLRLLPELLDAWRARR